VTLERLARVECPAFGLRRKGEAILLARGEGHHVWDVEGRRYVDLAAGFGAALLGHGHAAVVEAIRAQAGTLVQGLGDFHPNAVKLALLERLAALHPSGDAQVILGQSGADAITAAMKTATLHTGRHAFVAFDGGYHGLGYAPLAACGYAPAMRSPFAPQLNPHMRFAPYPGVRGAALGPALAMLEEQVDSRVAAIVVEPVLGRGGCIVPPDAFLPAVRAVAKKHGALVIADEIWTGLGRAGSMVRSLACEVEADILCFGKGLGGGMPISACVAPAKIMAAWASGDVVHTSTHAGAPLGCAAALATLGALEDEGLVARAAALGDETRTALAALLGSHAIVRGAGLMIGIELESAAVAKKAQDELLARGYLVVGGGIHRDCFTLTPALTIPREALLDFGAVLRQILE
jgi:4-aminobutyrate aminotransferase / (S)-3-amino-2-methylpropionate transaminase / 5-aminovalerate transaminase